MSKIRRIKRKKRFSVLPSAAIEDRRLSFKARGVLTYILSKPDHWQTKTAELIEAGPDGRDSIRAAIRELRRAGYMELKKERTPEGRIVSFYEVSEDPVLSDKLARPAAGDEKTGDGKPVAGTEATGDGKPVPLVNTECNNINISIYDTNKEETDKNVAVFIGDRLVKLGMILRESKSKKTQKTAGIFAEMAAALPARRWERISERYQDPDHFEETVKKMIEYYSRKTAALKKIKCFYLTLNNWLKKEWIDPSVAPYKTAYLDHVLRVSGVPYEFNNFDNAPDMIGIRGLFAKMEAHKAKIAEAAGVSPSLSEIDVFRAFLAALPAFWRSHRPASLNRNFTGILDKIQQTTKPETKKGRPPVSGYSQFSAGDIQNIL